jgi:hypothetical protein
MNHSKPDLSHLWVWGCQCFLIIPPELCTKGGPRQFEAIFVGYEENRIGWQVRDLHGKYSFSRDVIFNKLVPGHLSPQRGISVNFASLPSPSIISELQPNTTLPAITAHKPNTTPTLLYIPTISDTIRDRDTINARDQHMTRSTTNSLSKPKHHYNDIHTITSFISINHLSFPSLSSYSFKHTPHDDLYYLSLLSAPLLSFRHCITDLSKPLNPYHEALSRPDRDTWISVMK